MLQAKMNPVLGVFLILGILELKYAVSGLLRDSYDLPLENSSKTIKYNWYTTYYNFRTGDEQIEWRLSSVADFMLDILYFDASSAPYLAINSGKNENEMKTQRNISRQWFQWFQSYPTLLFHGPFLHLVLHKGSSLYYVAFEIKISATNLSLVDHCDEHSIPASEMCNFHVFCENYLDEENCKDDLIEGDNTTISYSYQNYSPRQKEEWRFWSVADYILVFSNLHMQEADYIAIKSGENVHEIYSQRNISGPYTKHYFSLAIDGPFLQLIFHHSGYVGAHLYVDIEVRNISSVVYCDGNAVPSWEICNFRAFCKNEIDEENCGHVDGEQSIQIRNSIMSNNFYDDSPCPNSTWILSSTLGYLIDISAAAVPFVTIENAPNQYEPYFANRLQKSQGHTITYAFDMPFLKIHITQCDKRVDVLEYTPYSSLFSYDDLNQRFEINIVTKNVTFDCEKVCLVQNLNESTGKIGSPPNSRLEVNYNCLCEWNIAVSSNSSIKLNITSLNLPCGSADLEILTSLKDRLPDQRSTVCGEESGLILSEGNKLSVRLKVDTGDDSRIFDAIYQEIETAGCGIIPFNTFSPTRNHTCRTSSAFIASANYPLRYEANIEWFWHITTSPSTYIQVKFEEFDIESSTDDCEEDYLEFQMRSAALRFCNSRKSLLNSSFLSDQNELTIKLHSDRSSLGGRFFASYSERKFVQNIPLQKNVTCRINNGRRLCYCLFNYHHALTWENASQECKSCSEGGYLAVIQSQQDMDMLQQFILQEGDPQQSAYIGLKWNDYHQRFVWITDQPLSFTAWKVSRNIEDRQPDGGGEEKCSMISLWSYRETKNWIDIPCDESLTSQFICQQPVGETGESFQITYIPGTTSDNCREDQTQCSSGECIFSIYLCDGFVDCSDQSDEVNCQTVEDGECPPYHFACENGGCVHSTVYCDHFKNCADGSDEKHCEYPPCTVNEFPCGDHRCILQSQVCDLVIDCNDGSDEENCEVAKVHLQCSSGRIFPARNMCDGYKDCLGKQSEDEPEECDYLQEFFKCNSTSQLKCENGPCAESSTRCIYEYDKFGFFIGCRDASLLSECERFECPPYHFKCPNSYCIPERYRCNKIFDCPYGEDEKLCDSYSCASGSYKCHGNTFTHETICLPKSQLCDGTAHCAEKDDELYCGYSCPNSCKCEGLVFECSGANWQQNMAEKLPQQLKELYLSGITLSENMPSPSVHDKLTITDVVLQNISSFHVLLILDLSRNKIDIVNEEDFQNSKNLRELYLGDNRIDVLHEDHFRSLGQLRILNLSGNPLTGIGDAPFKWLVNLKVLLIEGTDISSDKESIFSGLVQLETLYSGKFYFCCLNFAPSFNSCYPRAGPFSGCENLMQNSFLRMSLWLLGIAAVVGNGFVVIFRIYRRDVFPSRNRTPVQPILIMNLAIADFCMGVYLIIIAGADLTYDNVYFRYSELWQTSGLCKFAGFLSTLGSEASVMFLTVITIDRLQSIVFPFSSRKLQFRSTCTVTGCVWALAVTISIIPLVPFPYYYGRSSVCLALPLTNERRPGWFYSIFVFLIINFINFVFMLVSYIFIYRKASKSIRLGASAKSDRESKMDRQIEITMKMFFLVSTDMACWMPIILMGFLAQTGAVEISSDIYAWTAVFILPVNSALNPYLYTVMIKTARSVKQDSSISSRQVVVMESKESELNATHKHEGFCAGFPKEVIKEYNQQHLLLTLTPDSSKSKSLAHLIEQESITFSEKELDEIKKDLLEGVYSLHCNGIIHGGISSDHVIIEKGPGNKTLHYLLYALSNRTSSACNHKENLQSFEDLKQQDLQNLDRVMNSFSCQ